MEYHDDAVEHYCEAFPLEEEEEEEEQEQECSSCSSKEQYFNIKVEVRVMDMLNPYGEDADDLVTRYSNPTHHFFPNIPKDSLLKEQETTSEEEPILLNILSQMGVPHNAQHFMVAKILACGHDMAYRTHKTRKVLSIAVQIFLARVNEDQEQEPTIDEDEAMNVEGQDQGLVPATKASIEQLERVKVEGEEQKCAICLEDFVVGLQVIRMPCLHLYHDKCIVDWLHNGNSCPLCRFMMPTSPASEA